ncbi:MAG: Ribosomal protein [Pseudomonadota bacterium]|jgi:large subunit ribosomal protein L29
MKKSVVSQMTLPELRQQAGVLREEIFRLRFQHHTGQLQSTAKIRGAKRTLARVLTRIRAFELGDVATKEIEA